MNKDSLKNEYEKEGLTIVDFHLGLRLARPAFINTIIGAIVFLAYMIFLYSLFRMFQVNESDSKNLLGLFAILIIFGAKYVAKYVAYFYVFICFAILIIVIFDWDQQKMLNNIIQNPFAYAIFYGVFLIAITLMIIVYRVNRNIVLKDGTLTIPASDVEQNIFSFLILKPVWGMLYRKKVPLKNIVSVKLDGFGNKEKDIYPVIVTDIISSNRLVFTSRQKRDEFKTKISLLMGLSDSTNTAYGESE